MPRVLSNRYELGPLVGSGGSARVYEARDLLLDRRVAVKLLDSDAAASSDPSGRDRFLREAQALARFAHQHAVAVYDAGDVDGDLFIVMEFVEGTSLAHLIATSAPMSEPEVVRIGTQLLAALDAAHTAGLVHRDVKPSNVLIARTGEVKLADFGIAKRFDDLAESLTMVGSVIGTPQYLAPEQAAGRSATPHSDVYATGVVLYEMLTGTRPPPASPGAGVGADVRELRPAVSPRVAAAVSRSLAARPEDRFATAVDMAATLRGEQPTTAASLLAPTQLSPQHSVENTPTCVISPEDRTAVWAASTAPTELQPMRPSPRAGRARWVAVAPALVVLIAAIWFAILESSNNETISELGNPATATVPEQPTTARPTAPPTQPPPIDLIPGFPATDDIQQFIDQLRAGRDVAGKQSKRLGDELQKLLDMDPEQRTKDAEKLATQLGEWVDKGEIDPVVAGEAYQLLTGLSGPVP